MTDLRGLLEQSRLRSASLLQTLHERRWVYLLYALWAAGVTSAGEIVYWTYRKTSLTRVIGWQFLWAIPAGYFLLFGFLGGAFVLAGGRLRNRSVLGIEAFAAAFITCSAWLLLVGGLHRIAVVLLAAGLAVQSARFVVGHLYTFDLIVRSTAALLLVGVLGAASWALGWPRWLEYRTQASLVEPVPPDAPSVLLVVLDTVRAESLSLYGYSRATTPFLERLASQGVVFRRAFSTSPWTLPSHGTMFTGRYPHELSGGWFRPIDATYPTLAEVMSRQGYLTAGFVANLRYVGAEFGLARGFIHYEDHPVSLLAAARATAFGRGSIAALGLFSGSATQEGFGLKTAGDINREVLRWMSTRDRRRPYFAFLNYADAHAPYESPDEFESRFSTRRPPGDLWSRDLDKWSPDDVRLFNDAYDGAVAYLDAALRDLFAALEQAGDLSNTVVVVTSDHGEQFGEHGLLEHANSLYLPLLHVPLIIVPPGGLPRSLDVHAPVSLRDLPATVAELAAVPSPPFPGRSLARFWSQTALPPAPESVIAEVEQALAAYPVSYPARIGAMQSVVLDGMQYIRNKGNGKEELFDLEADPNGDDNLVAREQQAAARARAVLDQWHPPSDPPASARPSR